MEPDPAAVGANDAYRTPLDPGTPLPPGTLPRTEDAERSSTGASRDEGRASGGASGSDDEPGTADGGIDYEHDDAHELELAGLVEDDDEPPVDPMAPGRGVLEPSLAEVPEPNEPA